MYLYIVISLSMCKILNIIPRISREFSVWSQLSQSLTYIGRKKSKQNNNNNHHHNILKNKIKSICTKLKLFCCMTKISIPSKKTFFTDFVVVWIFGDYYTAIERNIYICTILICKKKNILSALLAWCPRIWTP